VGNTKAMKRTPAKFFTGLVLIFVAMNCSAQYYFYNDRYYDSDVLWEVGASGGLMIGVTDIGGKKGIMPNLKSRQGNAGFYAGAMYKGVAGLRLEVTWGRISGADSLGANVNRNLSYRTPIMETALIGEFHPLMLQYRDKPLVFSPYVAGGIGRISFNPQAKLGNAWVDLQPLRTEGQGFPEAAAYKAGTKPYELTGWTFIGGMGLRYEITRLIAVRTELLYRRSSTDYLDDASTFFADPVWFDKNLPSREAALARQLYDRTNEKFSDNQNSVGSFLRGNQKTKDGYVTFNLKLAFILGRQQR